MKKLIFVALLGIILSCNGDKRKYAVISTDLGDMKVVLFDDTPLHRDNFIKLVNEGFYDSLLFHRIIPEFMIQGGDPKSKNAAPDFNLGSGGPGYTVPAEIGIPHFNGMLAAARQGDGVNPQKASSGSQFYIVDGKKQSDDELDIAQKLKKIKYSEGQRERYRTEGGTPMLDNDYTVFGEVVEGLNIIHQIAMQPRGYGDRPHKDIRMTIKMVK